MLNIDGQILARTALRTPSAADPTAIIAEMRDWIEAIITAAGIDRGRVLGVGTASPGPIDADRGIVLDPPLLANWHGIALREELEKSTGLFVLLEKGVTTAALAEVWKSAGDERDDFVFFHYGTGTDVGFVLCREVIRGPSNNAGEAGHILVDPGGPVCRCGRRGYLGDTTSPEAIVTRAIAWGLIDAPGKVLETAVIDACFSRVAALANAGDTEPSACSMRWCTTWRMRSGASRSPAHRSATTSQPWGPRAWFSTPRCRRVRRRSTSRSSTPSGSHLDAVTFGVPCLDFN